jgi:uncharacterized membrane protein YdjX (TVP38/TMEM64 family)
MGATVKKRQSAPGRSTGGSSSIARSGRRLVTSAFTSCARRAHRQYGRPAWKKLVSLAVLILGLSLAWRYTPLAELITGERIRAWAEAVGNVKWSPLLVVAAYTPAVFLMFPRPVITLFAVIAYGPWMGFVTAMCGDVVAALSTYGAGRALPRNTVRELAGDKAAEISKAIRGHGVLPSFAASIAPVAPFPVVGMAAGAAGIKLWHFLLGNALGMAPGTLASTVFADQIAAALEDPSTINYGVIAAIAAGFLLLIFIVRRWLARLQKKS